MGVKFFLLLILSFSLGGPVFAQDVGDEVIDMYEKKIDERLTKEKEERIKERNRNAMEKALARTQKRVSKSIFSVSDSIDEFFAGERFQEEKNGSLVRFGYENLMVEKHEPRHKIKLNTRLVLPRTKNRLNFLLQSLEDEETTDEQKPANEKTFRTIEEERKQSFFAGLRFKNVQTREWSVNTDAGVKIVWPPDPFARLRLRKSFFMSKWELRLTENVFWFESDGWSQAAAIELERPIPPKNLLKFGNSGTRKDSIGHWEFTHGVSWSHQATPSTALAYGVGITSVEEPAYSLSSYFTSVAFRQNVFDNWIFLDIAPTGSWPRDQNFTFVPSIRIKFEAILGGL